MKTLDTIAGKMYVVMSPNGGTVTSADGLISETVEAGKQKIIIGTGAQLQLDDAAGKIVSTFNSAPAKLELLGLFGGGAKVDPLMKYAQCVTVADMLAVNPDYKNDLTPAGEWVYPLPKLKTADNKMFDKVRVFKSYMPSCLQAWTLFSNSLLKYFECDMPALNNTGYMFQNNQVIVYAKADLSSAVSTNYMFLKAGNLVDCYVKLPNLKDDNTLWNGCQLNKASVLYSVPTLPTWTDGGTHRFTIGIHVDHEFDEEVAAVISEAEAKGWAVTVQWNGTATAQAASTWGLRRKPIYAKQEEIVLPDGTQKTILAWGHYVTNWEENGYIEFASVEEANAYFGIQEELLTE